MKFLVRGTEIEIDDIYTSYSPLLSTMKSTTVNVEKEGDIPILDVDLDNFYQYIQFLKGEQFHMDSDIEELFDYMGHSNKMRYPTDYWKIKLQDNWIRDRFYELELYNDPYYGFMKLPTMRDCHIPLLDNMYIAGGYAMYLAGYTDTYKDVDIFFTDKNQLIPFLKSIKKNASNYVLRSNTLSFYLGIPSAGCHFDCQLIFRLYTSPSEIVHGFDLDCVGILYDRKNLWCTRRAFYSLENKINWFDPSRSSPSYAYRLSKYALRGFNVGLPLFDESKIQDKKVQDIFNKIYSLFEYHIDQSGIIDNGEIPCEVAIEKFQNKLMSSNTTHFIKEELYKFVDDIFDKKLRYTLSPGQMTRYLIGLIGNQDPLHKSGRYTNAIVKEMLSFIPKDPVSQLILSTKYKYFTCMWKISDYNPEKKQYDNHLDYRDVRKIQIQWKEQNPMEQVSSTFYPTPIQDLKEWYKTSPLYK